MRSAALPACLAIIAGSAATALAMPARALDGRARAAVADPPDGRLSNERTTTYWTYTIDAAPIRARPDVKAPTLAKLHFYNEDGFDEVYLLLAKVTDANGDAWVKLRIPGRPNGRTGWVPRDALDAFHMTHDQIVVDRRHLRITLYTNARRRWSAPVGIGKPSTPTPAGHYWIRERFRLVGRHSPYGPYAFGTADYSVLSEWPGGGIVGIHGDFGQPELIPGHPSHGCIRLRNRDIGWLGPRVGVGTPVYVGR